jgi:MscS family membrane protein
MNLLHFTILDNPPQNLLWFAGIILLAFIVKRYLSQLTGFLLYKIFQRGKSENSLTRFQSLVIPALQYVIFFLIVQLALGMLRYPDAWRINVWGYSLQRILNWTLLTIIWWSVTWLLLRMVEFMSFVLRQRALRTETKLDDQWVPFVKDTMKIIVLVFSGLFLLGVIYGLNITSLLAGVGIGGLAVALAAQESLKNLFGSLTIFMDQPFRLGDSVKIGDVQGTVEKIGFRSTRIRTADTTYVTLPNKVMVDSSVDNITSRNHLRVKMNLGLRYGIKSDALRSIISELKDALTSYIDTTAENYVVFDSFGESSLTISVQYFIPLKLNTEFLEEKEEINFRIMEIIERHGGEFSYPIQEIRMVNNGQEKSEVKKL